MTGLPTLLVKLDDGTGTFPYDVSAFVRLPAGVSITRGRTDEFNQVQPSSLSLVFDNTTGVFTLGSGTYGIAIDQRIQVTETVSGAVKRFTGYVQDWPVAWPDGSDTFAVAQVTAVDRLSRLARRKLRSITEHEILSDAPNALYALSEATGTTSAGDMSGNGQTPLTIAGSGTAPAFGAEGPNTWDGFTACTFAAGQYLAVLATSASYTGVEITFRTSDAATANQALVQLDNGSSLWRIEVNAGTLQTLRINPGPTTVVIATNVADGRPHVVYVGGASGMYFDGVPVGAGTVPTPTGSTLKIGSAANADLSMAAFFTTTLSDARVAAHANAILNGFATDTADQRVARIASYANIPTADQSLETGQQSATAAQSTIGQFAWDAIQAVSAAEGGLVFIQGDGKLVMQNKSHRVLKALGTAALTLTADQINPDVSLGGAKNYLYNTAAGARDGGALQRSVNAASVTSYEEYPVDLSNALLPSDELVLNILQWTTGKYGTPRPRLPAFTIDLLTTASATVQTILALEIGDLITVSGLPSQTPASLGGLLVEGWTENLAHDTWTITLNTVPSVLFYAPIVDTAGATCDTGYAVYF